MAIVKFGPVVVGARGTIAGTIFSANKGGPFARAWSKGANPSSALQTTQRGRLGSIASAWADLTQVQRDDWIAYAIDPAQELTNALGEDYFASGFNWYIKINQNLEAASEARRDLAPNLLASDPPILGAPQQLFVTGAAGNTNVRMSGVSPNIGFNHVVVARITGQGRTAIASGFVHQRIAVPDGGLRIFFQTEIESAFGTIALGLRMHFQIVIQNADGRRSQLVAAFTDALP